jgi:hypothetical protein
MAINRQVLTLLGTVEEEEDAFEELALQYVYPDMTDEQTQTWEHDDIPEWPFRRSQKILRCEK